MVSHGNDNIGIINFCQQVLRRSTSNKPKVKCQFTVVQDGCDVARGSPRGSIKSITPTVHNPENELLLLVEVHLVCFISIYSGVITSPVHSVEACCGRV